jgi:hypothetical protein
MTSDTRSQCAELNMDYDDTDDKCDAGCHLVALLADFKNKRAMTVDRPAGIPSGTRNETLEANVASLSRHLEKPRDDVGLHTAETETRIVHFTCSSTAVMAILAMLNGMFR